MHGILIHQVILDSKGTGIIEIRFTGRSILLQGLDDLGFALIEGFFAGLADIQIDQHLVQFWPIVRLNLGIFQPGTVQVRADRNHIRLV